MLFVSGLWIQVSLMGLSSRPQDHHSDKERQDWFLDGGKSIDQYKRHFKNAPKWLCMPKVFKQVVWMALCKQGKDDGKLIKRTLPLPYVCFPESASAMHTKPIALQVQTHPCDTQYGGIFLAIPNYLSSMLYVWTGTRKPLLKYSQKDQIMELSSHKCVIISTSTTSTSNNVVTWHALTFSLDLHFLSNS